MEDVVTELLYRAGKLEQVSSYMFDGKFHCIDKTRNV